MEDERCEHCNGMGCEACEPAWDEELERWG
jgi:hypothetical protein